MIPRQTLRDGAARPVFRLALIACAVLSLGACDTLFDKGGWLGDKKAPSLPGERVSVLSHSTALTTDLVEKGKKILLPPPTPNPDWPQAGGRPNHAMHHVAVAENLSRAWSASIGTGTDDELRINASPVVADGIVFTMDSETVVRAFRADNGRELWATDPRPESEKDDGHMPGGLAFDKGRLIATTGFNQIIALDASNGGIIWKREVEAPIHAPPTIRGGRVFVVTLTNRLYALSVYSGKPLWDYQALTEPASLLGGAAPAVDRGVVVAPFSSGELVALKVDNGRELWSDSLVSAKRTDVVSSLSHVRGRPVIDRGLVIAASHAGVMAAIDFRSGRRVWSRDIGSIESIWVAGDYLFGLTMSGEIIGMSKKDGKVVWATPLPRWEDEENKEGPITWTGPLLVGDRLVIAGSNGQSMAVSPYTGRILGTVEMPDRVRVPPVVADGAVFFLCDNAELLAYR